MTPADREIYLQAQMELLELLRMKYQVPRSQPPALELLPAPATHQLLPAQAPQLLPAPAPAPAPAPLLAPAAPSHLLPTQAPPQLLPVQAPQLLPSPARGIPSNSPMIKGAEKIMSTKEALKYLRNPTCYTSEIEDMYMAPAGTVWLFRPPIGTTDVSDWRNVGHQ